MGALRFSELRVQGFRRLLDARFELRPLNVLIGANGAGKTSVLDVLSLLANSATGKLSSAITDLSGLPAILTYDHADALQISISMEAADREPLDYSILLKPGGLAYTVAEERLIQGSQPGGVRRHIDSTGPNVVYHDVNQNEPVRPTWEHNPLETSLSQLPKMFREPEEFRSHLASLSHYHVLNIDARNGEELVSSLYYLKETEPDRFHAIEDALRVAYPRFDRLAFPPVAAGTLALAWRERGFSKPLYMHQLSDRLVRFLKPEEVLLMDTTEEGMTTVTRADSLDLGKWLEDYSLDELWQNGRLGARP